MQYKDITWAAFEQNNQDKTGAFEQLCSILFKHTILQKPHIFFHSNSNNPGIEIEPVDNGKGKKVSFQAKYFSEINYSQIMHSAEMAVKYYNGQLDIIYLYCNQDINTTSKPYQDIVAVLSAAGIQLEIITNNEILNIVIEHGWIASAFFGVPAIDDKWYRNQVASSLEALGEKYNKKFNVDTIADQKIDLFLHSNEAIYYINQKKKTVLENVKKLWYVDKKYKGYLEALTQSIDEIPDVEENNMEESFSWHAQILDVVKEYLNEISKELKEKQGKQYTDFDKKEDYQKWQQQIELLDNMKALPDGLAISVLDRGLISGKFLILKGNAGVGKSQALAYHATDRIDKESCSLLLLGSEFLTNDSVLEQIPQILNLDYGFEKLMSALERIAEKQKRFVVLFVDAINEASEKNIWKSGLIQLQDAVNKFQYIKVIVSMRNGYEKLIISDAFQNRIANGQVISIEHKGFENESVRATKDFLNYSGISFSPSYFFRTEMNNPLFLTLFCKVYDGTDFDLFSLFESLIKKADEESQKAIGLDGDNEILGSLIDELMEYFISSGNRTIEKRILLNLDFWNTYGITISKIQYLNSLVRSGLLTVFPVGEEEHYDITYDLMRDFLYAKKIIKAYASQEELRAYLKRDLLNVKDNKINNYGYENLFAIICEMYAEKYHSECIDIIEETQGWGKTKFFRRYLFSYSWRKREAINIDDFLSFVSRCQMDADEVYRVLIENSTKINHPLNVNFLHNHLVSKTLAARDYCWTTFINHLSFEYERVFQIIELFESEEEVAPENYELLLILLTWFLTASNRPLRDRVSQAMINILKEDVVYCTKLLQKFEGVNDPYIIERLYGIVFGACIKRNNEQKQEFLVLAKYVYKVVFDKDEVYPHILLIDYARLIIERWCYEYPEESDWVDLAKINPPYNSPDIQVVEKQSYYEEGTWGGFHTIARSMYPDNIQGGMYGDFGRYIYQSAASCFQGVDIENLYHASMQYIRDCLGYTDDYFDEYDKHCNRNCYSRNDNKKIERIGKKYQWITMHYMLARIADNHPLVEYGEEPHNYKGAWEIRVRDFDPTLNEKMINPPFLPYFEPCAYEESFGEDLEHSGEAIEKWINEKSCFFQTSDLIITDTDGKKWVFLYQHKEAKNRLYQLSSSSFEEKVGAKKIWKLALGSFVKKDEFEALRTTIQNANFMGRSFPENGDESRLYNRELPWSPSCEELKERQWKRYEIVKEQTPIKHKGNVPVDFKWDDDGNLTIVYEEKEWESKETITECVASVMPGTINLLFELEYDGSKGDTFAFTVPCLQILESLNLKQNKYDGFYFNDEKELVAFDGAKMGVCDGTVVRLDYMKKFLEDNQLVLFWTCMGEKQCFNGTNSWEQKWSEWSSFAYLDENDEIVGNYQQMGNKQ